MPTTPPGYTPPPADLPQRGDRATFSNRVDAWVTWFSTVILTQLAAIVANAYANAVEAAASAASAMGYRDTALTYRDAAQAARDAAQGYRDTALTYRDQAAASATAAAASATAAANSAASIIATSPTDQTLGTGTFVFVTQAGKQFSVGADVKAVDQTNSGNAIYGTVAAYSGTSLTITGTSFTGTGVVSDWNISLSGQRGAQGPTGSLSGGNLTGALNDAKGADVASATTMDIWSGAGNYETVTGTATITGFTAAPQAGAHRRILAGGTFTLTAGTNMVIHGVASGTSYTVAAGDEIDVYAETTTKFQIAITKGDGTAMAALYGAFQNTRRINASGAFVASKTGWHRITGIGGSGRGGLVRGGATQRATGAGAGGLFVGMRFLIAGQSYTCVVAAAVSNATTSTNGTTAGITGNSTSFSGSGIITMTANGGGGGLASSTDGALAGGVGGTATGGDINVQGGDGGAILGTGGAQVATGGGSVGIQGIGRRGGNITSSDSVATSQSKASGGAGVGGNGGDISSAVHTASGGGGAGGAAAAVTTGTTTGLGGLNFGGLQSTAVAVLGEATTIMNATAGGPTAGTVSANAGAGGGGLVEGNPNGVAAGVFAGGSGSASQAVSTVLGTAGGLYGGAPGGVASGGGTITTGPATGGLLQIEF